MTARKTLTSSSSFMESPAFAAILIVAYLILAILPLILAGIFNDQIARASDSTARTFARNIALLAFSLLTLQVVMGSRLPMLDRPFGLDIVMKFHRNMAVFAMILLLAHPVLLAIGAGTAHYFSPQASWLLNVGQLSLLALVFSVVLSLTFRRLGVDYNNWRIVHKSMPLVLVLAFIHSIMIGSHLQAAPMRIYWSIIFAIPLALWLWRNLYVWLWGRRRFVVESVTPETHNTFTLLFKPEKGEVPAYKPGQFMFLTLLRPKGVTQEHPFTISSSPTMGGFLTASIKKSGDFTDTIDQTSPGDKAVIEAPWGRFSLAFKPAIKSFLFIAGGVGITPLRSMIRYLQDTGDDRKVTLLYSNRIEADIIFRNEFDSLPSNMRVVYVITLPSVQWNGPSGYINEEIIREYAADLLDEADVFLCGPPPMMKAVLKSLGHLHVPDGRIHLERFTI